MSDKRTETKQVPIEFVGLRFDQALAKMFPDFSRSKLQTWIKQGKVLVAGKKPRARDKIMGGELIEIEITPEKVVVSEAQAIDLPIIYEDASLIILNKPKGLVVHPGAGNKDSTLMNGLLHYLPALETVPRAGIVHRLDKDTTGLMVIAKSLEAHNYLVSELEQRNIKREYLALCRGRITAGKTINKHLGRHPTHRTKMSVLSPQQSGAKSAVTHYRVVDRVSAYTLVRCELETGRTHQIRVHMAYEKFPLVGDQTYGGRLHLPKGASDELQTLFRQFKRQALHAFRLGFKHPDWKRFVQWEIALPNDIQTLIEHLALEFPK